MKSSIWHASTRAAGMGFAYGLIGFGKFQILRFRIRRLFRISVFRFQGGPEIARNPTGDGCGICLWFALTGGFFDRRFSGNGDRLK